MQRNSHLGAVRHIVLPFHAELLGDLNDLLLKNHPVSLRGLLIGTEIDTISILNNKHLGDITQRAKKKRRHCSRRWFIQKSSRCFLKKSFAELSDGLILIRPKLSFILLELDSNRADQVISEVRLLFESFLKAIHAEKRLENRNIAEMDFMP